MRVGVILLGSTERRRDSTVSTRNGSIPTVVVDVLDADVATEKRAQWEAFEFITLGDGDVEVVNDRRNERGWSAPSGIRTLVLAVRGQDDWPDYTNGAHRILSGRNV